MNDKNARFFCVSLAFERLIVEDTEHKTKVWSTLAIKLSLIVKNKAKNIHLFMKKNEYNMSLTGHSWVGGCSSGCLRPCFIS